MDKSFDPEAVAYYTASQLRLRPVTSEPFNECTGELFRGTICTIRKLISLTKTFLISRVKQVIAGSSGNSDSGARDYTAWYFRLGISLLDGRGEAQLAARQMITLILVQTSTYSERFICCHENLTVRASGTGFKAPGLGSMFGATSYSADYHIDYVYCEANGIARQIVVKKTKSTLIASNPNLGPEESESMNFLLYTILNYLVIIRLL